MYYNSKEAHICASRFVAKDPNFAMLSVYSQIGVQVCIVLDYKNLVSNI